MTAEALAQAVLSALADVDTALAHRLLAMEPEERERVERHCAAAVERAGG